MAQAPSAHIPPQNLEAEESVLGAMMVSEGSITPVILDVRLHAEDFYRDRHRAIFAAIRTLYERSEPIDALTVSEFLAQHGDLDEAGGKDQVATLASTVPAPGNARHYAQIVKQNALLRRLLGAAQTIQQSVHERDGEPEALVEDAERMLFRGRPRGPRERLPQDHRGPRDEIDRLEQLAKGDAELTGVASGFRDLDRDHRRLSARQPDRRRRAAGDGQERAGLERRRARRRQHGAARRVLLARDVGGRARAPLHRLAGADLERQAAPRQGRDAATGRTSCAPATSSSRRRCGSTTPPTSGCSTCAPRRAACTPSERGLGVVIVDYLQLMRAEDPRQNRVEQVGQISRGLKILARELDVPVIGALAALARARAAPRQAADPLRPERVGKHRAGRRRRRLPLPRRVLQPASPRTRESPS